MKNNRPLSRYDHDEKANGTRRFFSALLDASIMIIVMFLVSILTSLTLGNISSYTDKIDIVNSKRIECYKIEEEAHIYRFLNNEDGEYEHPMELEAIFEEYVYSEILLAYEKDPDSFQRYNVVPDADINVEKASYENNQLSYFLVNYAVTYNSYGGSEADVYDFEGQDPRFSYIKELKEASPKIDHWNIDETTLEYPYLDGVYAVDLYRYLFGGEEEYQTGLTNYNYLASTFRVLWEKEVDWLVSSERFQEHYRVYVDNYADCSQTLVIATSLAYLLTLLLCIALPMFLFKDGQTIGMKAMKLKVVSMSHEVPSIGQKILRTLVYLFAYLPIIPISTFFSGGATSGLYYPLFVINGIGISFVHITFFLIVVGIINFLMIAAKKDKRGIVDLASNSKVVDIRLHGDIVEIVEPKDDDLETIRERNDQKTVFDSDSFNNTERPKRQ